jgi:hypothetical protein
MDNEMQPGRELDALIATKVMGITIPSWLEVPAGLQTMTSREVVPPYSTDLSDAWHIIERLHELGWHYEVGQCVNSARHYASFGSGFYSTIDNCFETEFTAASDTPAHAICLAALEVLD